MFDTTIEKLNIEIDLEDLDRLEQAARELRHILLLVEAAIREKRQMDDAMVGVQLSLPTALTVARTEPSDLSKTEQTVRNTIATLGDEFTSREVVVRAAGLTRASRSSIVAAVQKICALGEIDLIKPGRGRSPARYRKTNLPRTRISASG